MEKFVNKHFIISWSFFVLAIVVGFLYSLSLLGFTISQDVEALRSVHISLMLYGFVPLMLSLLPFVLFEKDGVLDEKSLLFLNIYFFIWYFFLSLMIITLLLGDRRALAFYDFDYRLNFILALSGLFYIAAIFRAIKNYRVLPLWVKISLAVVIVAPFALLILMNPQIGQVEQTISGPHGDNTLGMSFAIIPLFYLVIKIYSDENFAQKRAYLWIIPFVGYIISVLMRNIYGSITYNEEWFFQYLSLFYIPLLYFWLRDSKLTFKDAPHLYIAIIAFLAVDVEGNILFVPELRWLFHRNDLIVAHAHIAMGISLFFLSLAIIGKYVNFVRGEFFIKGYLVALILMSVALSISGFVQTGILDFDITYLWILRSISGVLALFIALKLYVDLSEKIEFNTINMYNLVGFASDAIGGVFLIFFASSIYPVLGFGFSGVYEYVVFSFMIGVGVIHFLGVFENGYIYAQATAIVRIVAGMMFVSLFLSQKLGVEAMIVAFYDLFYAFIFIYIKEKVK